MGILKAIGMGLFLGIANVGRQVLINNGFEDGQNTRPPQVQLNETSQRVYDEAYELGRQSVLPRAVNRVSEKILDDE